MESIVKNSNKLALNKQVVTNLNDSQMNQVEGGSTVPCGTAIASLVIGSIALSYAVVSAAAASVQISMGISSQPCRDGFAVGNDLVTNETITQ